MVSKATPAQLKAIANYDKQHTTTVLIKLNNKTDADIIKILNESGNKQGAIKAALRAYYGVNNRVIRKNKQP